MSFMSVFSRLGPKRVLGVLGLGVLVIGAASATPLPGTVSLTPGSSVFPGVVTPGNSPGTLLATLVAPYSYSTTAGTTSGTIDEAVYMNASGTLDFYYQVNNSAASATGIARETDTNFAGFLTNVGFLIDGGTTLGGIFSNGTVTPVFVDDNVSGSVIGFRFDDIPADNVLPGSSSTVFVISTNAQYFIPGNASVIDGGTQTVAGFQPTLVPEPTSLFLIGGGLLAIAGIRRRTTARK